MNRGLKLATRRTQQTLTSFRGGLGLLRQIGLAGTDATLEFRTHDGLVIHCPNRPGARVPVYEIFAEDTYRVEEMLRPHLRPDAVVLDVGAHIGCFAVSLAHAMPQCTVHAYEASPTTGGWLARNVAANSLGDRIEVHHVALSDADGEIEFPDNEGGSSLNGLTAPTGAATLKVPAMTFAAAVTAAGGRVDLVKMDTEGAEYDIVLGSSPADWANVQVVVMEYHDAPGPGRAELEAFLGKAGLHVVRHQAAGPRQGTLWLTREA